MDNSRTYYTRSHRSRGQAGETSDGRMHDCGSQSASSSSQAAQPHSNAPFTPRRSSRTRQHLPRRADGEERPSSFLEPDPSSLTREATNRGGNRSSRRINNRNRRRRGNAQPSPNAPQSQPQGHPYLDTANLENLPPSPSPPASDSLPDAEPSSSLQLPSPRLARIAVAFAEDRADTLGTETETEPVTPWELLEPDPYIGDWEDEDWRDPEFLDIVASLEGGVPNPLRRSLGLSRSLSQSSADGIMFRGRPEPNVPKRSREKFETVDSKGMANALRNKEAVAVIMYRSGIFAAQANDIWPALRDPGKLPARYYRIDKTLKRQSGTKSRRRPTKVLKTTHTSDVTTAQLPNASSSSPSPGRPVWNLPVELVEMIASYLNRDDIKSLRLVSRELNRNVSQVLFRTVVVPFNTEIYGMLGQDQTLDVKGKKKAGASNFIWKNANGDDVYNGHGLDVFRGFGAHIIKFGMSFEVTEDALAKPPVKTLTERHESFWGTYDWPFVEYRRFEDVAGLEVAADETPRMTTAFSELAKVQELALSVDAGLGWLNGPDRSIRSRILHRPPEVFGTLKEIPDRRTQAQRELWQHIEACHAAADSDLTLATLYKLEAAQPPSETQEANLALEEQPEIPFVDPHVIAEALPHDTTDLSVPMSFEDPEVLDRFVTPPTPSNAGILFTSKIQPVDAGQLINAVIPSTLTKAQKEWLMEIEWAQRAFISSYMLSIIDNPKTFSLVHTLNISRLSDRYISLLNREDFWAALPNLSNVTLMVLPCWRTIHKDEAGFVDTRKINPCSEIDSVVALLKRMISQRPKIHDLTLGWASGGEHAEGVHARNKLLQPAPLLGLDTITSQNAAILQQALVLFPFVERFTLKNCWMTPLALQEFVKAHDGLRLKHLVLDSVSLTAILRPPQIHIAAQHVNNLAWNPLVPGHAQALTLQAHAVAVQNLGPHQNILNPIQFFQIQLQLLQIHLQQLQQGNVPGGNQNQANALQAHVQQLVIQGPAQPYAAHGLLMNIIQQILQAHAQWQQAQFAPQAPPVPAAAAAGPAANNTQTLLSAAPREGSWINVIDIITPGPNLRDLGSDHSQADEERTTSLKTIEFNSCGYARLPYSSFDQAVFDDGNGGGRQRTDPIFTKRAQTISPSMLSAKWAFLGEIVQETSSEELGTLYAAWNMETGWKDADEAKAPQFDGLLPGGTGRFTGVVRAEDRVEQATTNVDKFATKLSELSLDTD